MFFTGGGGGVFLMFYLLYGAVSYGYRLLAGRQQRLLQQLSLLSLLSRQRGAACAISGAEVSD